MPPAKTLIAPGTRQSVLSQWYALAAAAPPPPPAPNAKVAPGKPQVPLAKPEAADAPFEPQPYDAKPDELVTCPSCEKHNDVDASYCDQCGFKLKGAEGVVVADTPAPPDDAPAPPAGKPAAKPAAPGPKFATAPPAPVAATGDVEPDTVCQDAACNHLASGHDDTPAGANTGPCKMLNCNCTNMQVPGDTDLDAPPTTSTDADLAIGDPPLPPQDGLLGPAFTIPVGIIEGTPTQDGRVIAPNALTWRDPPQPLMFLPTTSHGFDSQAGPAVLVGRIEQISRQGDTITATGHVLTTEDGLAFADVLQQMGRLGISADVADTQSEITLPDAPSAVEDVFADPLPAANAMPMETLLSGVIMGFTSCMHPAFPGAYVVLGDGSQDDPSIPMEAPTPEQAAMGIHILSEHECEPCKDGYAALTASAAPSAPPRQWFEMPEPDQVVPWTVTDDGQVFGHVAAWGTCHVGFKGQCITPPHSPSGYAYYHLGSVVCDDGTEVATGPLTVGTTHANLTMSAAGTMSHYEHTGMAVADVAVKDGVHGIWACGSLRPWASDEQIRLLRASPPSGDWREQRGALELTAVLNVNTPGFPTPRAMAASGRVRSLVAAGLEPIIQIRREEAGLDPAARFARMERVVLAMAPAAAQNLRDRFAAVG